MPPSPTLIEQAVQAYARQDLQTAAALCDEVLRIDRKDVNATLLAADIAMVAGHSTQARSHLNNAVKLQSKNAEVRAKVGHILARDGDYAKATEQFAKALRLDPNLIEARIGLARAYERQGKYDKAREQLRSYRPGHGLTAEIATVRIRLLLQAGDVDGAIALGEHARDDGGPEVRRSMLFELARAYERAGRIDDAFRCAEDANATNAPPFDRAAHRERLEALKGAFSKDRLASMPRAAVNGEKPIFIVGMPRSGSTLVDRVIHAHPDAFGVGERPTVHRLAYSLHARLGSSEIYPACVPLLDQASVDALRGDYLAEVRRVAGRAPRIADKNLGSFLHLGLIAAFAPDAKVIRCVRDPVDNCLSCYMEPLSAGGTPYASRLEDLGFYYRSYDDLMAHSRAVLDVAYLEVRYEDLVADQERVTRQVLEFCELPWNESCLRFHELKRPEATLSFDQVRKPLYSSSVGRAERFGAHLDPLRKSLE